MSIIGANPGLNPFDTVWETVIPQNTERALLRACLLSGQKAQESWEEFIQLAGDPEAWFKANSTGVKALLPMIGYKIERNNLPVSADFMTWVRMSTLREELRNKEIQAVLGDVSICLKEKQVPAILLPGMATAKLAWEQPTLRHNHAIRLLVHDSAAATIALEGLNVTATHRAAHSLWLVHPTGLAIELHQEVHPEYGPTNAIEKPPATADSPIPLTGLDDQLIAVLAKAAAGDGTFNLRWIVDLHALLSAGAIASEAVAQRIATWLDEVQLTPFARVLDHYLQADFDIELPFVTSVVTSGFNNKSGERRRLYRTLSRLNRRRTATQRLGLFSGKLRYLLWLARERVSGERRRQSDLPAGAVEAVRH